MTIRQPVSFKYFAAIIMFCLALLAGAASAAPFAYITNENSNRISVIDVATNTVATTVLVGTGMKGVTVAAL